MRKFRAFGYALTVAIGIGVIAAGNAAAQQGALTAPEPVTMTGTQTGELFANAETGSLGVVTCPGGTATGHKILTDSETAEGKEHEFIESGATTFTLTSHSMPECFVHIPVLGTRPVTVTQNGCDVVGHIGETTEENVYSVSADLVCPEGNAIETHVYKANSTEHAVGDSICTTKVHPQSDLTGISVASTEGDIDIYGTINGVETEHTGSLCGTGSSSWTLHMDVTAEGHNELGERIPVAITD